MPDSSLGQWGCNYTSWIHRACSKERSGAECTARPATCTRQGGRKQPASAVSGDWAEVSIHIPGVAKPGVLIKAVTSEQVCSNPVWSRDPFLLHQVLKLSKWQKRCCL